jgi:hypothetical protein
MRRRGIGRVGRPGLVGTAARTAVIAGTATAVSGKVAAAQQAAAQPAVAPPAVEAAPPPAPPAAGPGPATAPAPAPPADALTDEVVDQLRKLAELRDAGIVTDEEFTAKKRVLLGL